MPMIKKTLIVSMIMMMLTLIVYSNIIIDQNIDHVCTGHKCETCQKIKLYVNIVEGFNAMIILAVSSMVFYLVYRRLRKSLTFIDIIRMNPISLKVKLLN